MSEQSLVRSSAVMAGGTFVSRLLGVVRASMLTALLGVSGALGYDAFSTANTVPTTIYNLVAGGLLNAVLVPQIVRAAKHDDGGEDFLNRLLTLALVGLVAVTVVVVSLSPLVPVIFTTSRWDSHAVALCVAFAFWCMPQVFFYGAYTMLGQVLNARGNFGPYMWAPVANNVVAIAGIGVLLVSVGGAGHHPRPPSAWTAGQIAMLGGTATLGVAVQALVLLWPLRALGIRYRPRFGWRGVGLRSAGRVAGWTFFAALVGQLGFIVTSRVVTSAVAQGGPGKGAYDNAFLLFMLPHSLITVSLVTALFTRMSRAAAAGETGEVRRDVSLGLRMTGVATILATAAVLALGPDMASTLFAGNTLRDTDAIAYTTMAMILGVVPFSAQYLLQRAFYAYEDARTPFLIQLPVIATGATTALIALRVLSPKWIVVGVGVGLSAGYALGALISFLVLRRRIGGVEGRSVLRTYIRLAIAAVISAVPALVITRGLHHVLGEGKAVGLLALAAGGAAMLATYVFACHRMKVTELDDLIGPSSDGSAPRGVRPKASPNLKSEPPDAEPGGMVKRALRDDSSDRGDMIVGWLAKIVVVIGVIGVLGFDGVTAIQAQVTTRDQATSAAAAGQANFVNTHNVQTAYQAALADAHASNSKDSITPADFVVANDGTVTLKLTRPVHTLVAHYLGISAATSASATGVARPGS